MKATLLDLRRNLRRILDAIERNEAVTISRRGRPIARIIPEKAARAFSVRNSPAFGMWKDRTDMKDPTEYVRRMRRGRFGDL
jgi:prevent-host-death family protein